MTSLLIMIAMLLIGLLVQAWVLARIARAVGSTRGRLWTGMVVCLIAIAISLGISTLANALAQATVPGPAASAFMLLGALLGMLMVEAGLIFLVIWRAFALTIGRTFAPAGAYLLMVLVNLALAVFIIKPHVVEAFTLSGKSMEPTLNPGDRFLVNKMSKPRRFDLIAYHPPGNPQTTLCHRLIALPGERLRIERDGIYINDQLLALPSVMAGRIQSHRPLPEAYGQTIPLGSDEYFMIGDNMALSADSHRAGPAPASAIIGVVDMIYWPLGRMSILR